jgi:hypothetical protein
VSWRDGRVTVRLARACTGACSVERVISTRCRCSAAGPHACCRSGDRSRLRRASLAAQRPRKGPSPRPQPVPPRQPVPRPQPRCRRQPGLLRQPDPLRQPGPSRQPARHTRPGAGRPPSPPQHPWLSRRTGFPRRWRRRPRRLRWAGQRGWSSPAWRSPLRTAPDGDAGHYAHLARSGADHGGQRCRRPAVRDHTWTCRGDRAAQVPGIGPDHCRSAASHGDRGAVRAFPPSGGRPAWRATPASPWCGSARRGSRTPRAPDRSPRG